LAAKLGEQYAEGDGAVAVRQLLDAHNAATAAAAAAAAAAAVLPVPDDDSDVDSQDDGAGSTTSEEAHGGAGRDKADATAPQRRPALDPKWRNFIALALVNRDVRGVQRGFHKALDVYNKYKDVFEANGVTLRAVRDVLTAAGRAAYLDTPTGRKEVEKALAAAVAAGKKVSAEGTVVRAGRNGRPPTFKPEWYEELKQRAVELQDHLYLGVQLVQGLATAIHQLHTPPPIVLWSPSRAWARRFLIKRMGMTMRRVTGHRPAAVDLEQQDRLHRLNLERLALLLVRGMPKATIYSCDEYGLLLYPQAKCQWATKGSQHVWGSMKEDKRQMTGYIVGNAEGAVVVSHMIVAGKSERSLPSLALREAHKDMQSHAVQLHRQPLVQPQHQGGPGAADLGAQAGLLQDPPP